MRRVVPLLIVLSLGFAPAPVYRERRNADDSKALQGAWHRARVTIDGVHHTETGRETTIEIVGDRMKYAVAGEPSNEWVFTLDVKLGRLDRKGIKGHADGLAYLGIYRIEGGTFTLCSCDGKRPANFAETGQGVFVEVYKRIKR
jgi:uncharacterized protein (TIGR03067 family)